MYEDGTKSYRVDVAADYVKWLVIYAEDFDIVFFEGMQVANYVITETQTWDAGRLGHNIETSKFVKLVKCTAKAAQFLKVRKPPLLSPPHIC
ncbi:hypothetical protein LguiB_028547 [Lonicera macranthoides]